MIIALQNLLRSPGDKTADEIQAVEASWRATLVKERAAHLNEVRLKDQFRSRAIEAEAKVRRQHDMLAELFKRLVPSVVHLGEAEVLRAHVAAGKLLLDWQEQSADAAPTNMAADRAEEVG